LKKDHRVQIRSFKRLDVRLCLSPSKSPIYKDHLVLKVRSDLLGLKARRDLPVMGRVVKVL